MACELLLIVCDSHSDVDGWIYELDPIFIYLTTTTIILLKLQSCVEIMDY